MTTPSCIKMQNLSHKIQNQHVESKHQQQHWHHIQY